MPVCVVLSMRWLPGLLVLLLLAACGQSGAGGSVAIGGPDPSVQRRLLQAADRAAGANNGRAERVEAVASTRSKANMLLSGATGMSDEDVWVVQVQGTFVCDVCSRPRGAAAPTGHFITMVLRQSDFETTDSGIGPNKSDLSKLGAVTVLRG